MYLKRIKIPSTYQNSFLRGQACVVYVFSWTVPHQMCVFTTEGPNFFSMHDNEKQIKELMFSLGVIKVQKMSLICQDSGPRDTFS